MAEHTMTADDVSTGKLQLIAGEVLTVHVQGFNLLELISDGTAELWYTTGDRAPEVGGRHCFYLPGGAVVADDRRAVIGTRTLQLISTGTPTIVLQRG
ncbi:hypothetical protein GCM10009737_08170 [Nocardioides lentus]|uniref:Uncharacterized protein n=1 Tax=Nocardioides lentus TaxID=338077 RepID=A0ABN2P0T2_9ACTN